MPKILFLYTELAGYNFPCFDELLSKNISILIIAYPVNKEAPFQFDYTKYPIIHFTNETAKQIEQKILTFNPSVVYCSGWINKQYLKWCKFFKKQGISTIVGFDNQWTGNLKQQIASLLSFKLIKPYFNYAWVPGNPQYTFALNLGFKKEQILTGVYTANTHLFNSFYNPYKTIKKRFIYVGRYYEFKGITDLWKAFIELNNEEPANRWELWCLGTGDVPPLNHPQIKHFGFVQPTDLKFYIEQTNVFVLPSRFEPWGVVVHEFAAAGFPLICSDKVGAATTFLKDEENGFIFKSGNIQQLKDCLKRITQMDEKQLNQMGNVSYQLSQKITPEKWFKNLLSVIKK
jgi:glycosyltransferase involved in cell wall biosynthesis